MPTVAVMAPELTGLSGLSLYLYATDGTLLNSGGDALSESPSGSGRFTCTVGETIAALYHARVHDASGVVRDGWLPSGTTLVIDSYPCESGSGGGGGIGDASQTTLLAVQSLVNALAASLSGETQVNVVAPVSEGNTLTLILGDDYRIRSGTQVRLQIPDTTGAILTLLQADDTVISFGAGSGRAAGAIVGTVDPDNCTRASNVTTVPVELTATQLSAADPRQVYTWQLKTAVTYTVGDDEETDRHTIAEGRLILLYDRA
jgi:hypothetical protein